LRKGFTDFRKTIRKRHIPREIRFLESYTKTIETLLTLRRSPHGPVPEIR
jgi:hypothetical protein